MSIAASANCIAAPFCPPYLSDSLIPWQMSLLSFSLYRYLSLFNNVLGQKEPLHNISTIGKVTINYGLH